jgi:hypothetical protein
VGCANHTLDDWLANAEAIGAVNEYTPREIAEYRLYFELADKLRTLRSETPESPVPYLRDRLNAHDAPLEAAHAEPN